MSTPRRLRVGVLGAGAWASFAHLPGFTRDPRCEVVAIADPQRDLADAAAQRFGIPDVYTDHQSLIGRDDIDIVDVCTPSATHFELAWAALSAGKHVLCEKPVAYDFRDTRRAAALAASKGLKTKLGFTFRYAPALRYMRELVEQGFIGEPYIFNGFEQNSQWIDPKTPLRQANHEADQSVLQVSSLEGYGAPIIDIAHLLVGSDLSSVIGTMRNFVPERMVRATGRMMRMNIDDGDIFMGEFANGALCSIQTSFVTVGNYPGHRGAALRVEGRPHLPPGRGRRHLRAPVGRHSGPGRVPRAAGAGTLLSHRGDARGIVALAVLRQPGRQLHHGDPRRRHRQRRQLRGWRVGAGNDQRRREVLPGTAMGESATRVDAGTALDRFFAAYYRQRPVTATFTGVHDHDHRLPDWSPEGLDRGRRRDARAPARAGCSRPRAGR